MRVGYVEKQLDTDGGRIGKALIFTKGCNLRCGYCGHAELLGSCEGPMNKDWSFALKFLFGQREDIDTVVFTGGEPTIQEDLEECILEVRAMGLRVELETNGTKPDVLRNLLSKQLLDFVAMDVKAPLENYLGVVGCRVDTEAIRTSIWIIKQSGAAHEFRTTVVPGLHTAREIKLIAELIHGAQRYVVQDFISDKPVRRDLQHRPAFPHKPLEEIRAYVERRVGAYEIRHSEKAKPMPLLRRRSRCSLHS